MLFGTMQVEVGGTSLAGKLAKKECWLLALLALRPDHAVTREYLAGLLWADADEELALFYLRRSLSKVRAALGAEGERLEVIKPRSLRLHLHGAYSDVREFDRLIAKKETAALEQAVALYRAPLLEDCQEDWAFQERVQREVAHQQALETLAEQAVVRSEWTNAIRYTRLLIAADPLQEKAHRLLMLAQASSGNHAAALQAYRDLRVRLREEINVDPDAETVALHEEIRRQVRQNTTPRPQIQVALLPSAPSLPFPQPITRIIGREEEQEEVQAFLRSSRLVMLTAAGGVGKTRLAIEVAGQASKDFRDGAVFVELAPVVDPERVWRAVAQALGIQEEANSALSATLCRALQNQERLIVLDNCEHLIDACAVLAQTLLSSCPHVRLLATSRQALNVTGETVWRVPSLPIPPDFDALAPIRQAKMDASALLEYPSVQLFLERVRQTLPEFRLTPNVLPFIAQICRRLDGIPLALELAASRIRTLSLESIAARLDDRFRLLTGGSRAALPRHQTLRATLDWSYVLLSEVEKILLRRLSVFVGGWTLEAVESVCSSDGLEEWEVLDVLTGLADKSLVTVNNVQGEIRYHFMETMRQYAAEELEECGENSALNVRHQGWFLTWAEEAAAHGNSAEKEVWDRRMTQEAENLRAALRWSHNDPNGADAEIRLAGALARHWNEHGLWREALGFLQAALSREASADSWKQRAQAVTGAGVMAQNLCDFELAQQLHAQALAIRQQANDRRGMGISFHNLGNVALIQGDFAAALENFAQACALHQEIGNCWGEAQTRIALGNAQLALNDFAAARRSYEEALTICEEVQAIHGKVLALGNLGCLLLAEHKPSDALPRFQAAIDLAREADYPAGEATYLIEMGDALRQLDDIQRAGDCLQQALRLAQKLDSKQHLLSGLELQALLLPAGKEESAVRLYGCAKAQRERFHLPCPDSAQREHHAHLQALRSKLGEAKFKALWAEGEILSLEAASGVEH